MALFKNPWGKGSAEHDKWFKNPWENNLDPEASAIEKNFQNLFSKEPLDIARGAEDLASNSDVMTNYWKFQEREQGWFFSPNPNLNSATKKPAKFTGWDDWYDFATNQKQTLSDLAAFESSSAIKKNNTDLKKLSDAYVKWPSGLYSVFWSIPEGSEEETFTCNIFVGDAIYRAGKSVVNSERKYYSAKQIYDAVKPFSTVEKKDAARGHIAAFGGTHLEVVTKVYMDGEDKLFCSRGGGRSSKEEMGEEKCGEGSWWWSTDREVNDEDIHFLTL